MKTLNDSNIIGWKEEDMKNISELSSSDEDKMIKDYTMPDGTVFTMKMFNDLLMWTNFAHDYHYDKLGIKQLRYDIKKLKAYKHKYGDMSNDEAIDYLEKHNINNYDKQD